MLHASISGRLTTRRLGRGHHDDPKRTAGQADGTGGTKSVQEVHHNRPEGEGNPVCEDAKGYLRAPEECPPFLQET